MSQSRSTKVISMIQWIRTSRLSIDNSVSLSQYGLQGRDVAAANKSGRLAPSGVVGAYAWRPC